MQGARNGKPTAHELASHHTSSHLQPPSSQTLNPEH